MRTETEVLKNYYVKYNLEEIAPWDKILFLDIETTGFSSSSSSLYLIGCAYFKDTNWELIQWLADSYEEERDILEAFWGFASRFTHLVHFNGNNFDLPFILQKCIQYQLPYTFDRFEGIDIYRRIAPFRELLRLPNCKQKTIENFLDISRLDIYNGRDMISVYKDYIASPSIEGRYLLFLHNGDDIRGMLEILPILAYYDLFNGNVKARKVQVNYYTDYYGEKKNTLFMKLSLPSPLPRSLSVSGKGCVFKGDGSNGHLAIPLTQGELKFFHANYKDYYYLPAEDCAMHKSIAAYVDREYRKQATAATCYSRKTSTFLPQWEIIIQPFFKREYNEREYFFEITDEIKKDRQLFSTYANHVLHMLIQKAN